MTAQSFAHVWFAFGLPLSATPKGILDLAIAMFDSSSVNHLALTMR
jgi:hypothetical protein